MKKYITLLFLTIEYYKYIYFFSKKNYSIHYIKSSANFLLDLSRTFGQENSKNG